jgi:hypothetical protein
MERKYKLSRYEVIKIIADHVAKETMTTGRYKVTINIYKDTVSGEATVDADVVYLDGGDGE